VSELLSGQLLSEVLSARGKLPLSEAMEICLQAAAGLQAAHQVGVAHGRISPNAILLSSDDESGVLVKLVGFDFSWFGAYPAHALAQTLEDQYSSPERLAGSAPDEVGDVFSLGAVLYHALVGAPPGNDRVPRSVPAAVRRVLERALAPADQRYPTVAALAEALRQATEPAAMRPRSARWRSGWLAASVALLFVTASLVWGWERIRPDLERIPQILKTGASTLTSTAMSRAKAVTAGPRKQPVETGVVRRSQAADSTAKPSPGPERPDTNRGPYISPFRRAHPWAAQPKGETYFPSSCPLALQSSELVYFRTEQEARATGRSRSKEPSCS
jgi:serine/threonine protein kinase